MSQKIPVPNPITPVNITAINTNSAAIQAILDAAKINLSYQQKKSELGIAITRESEVIDVNNMLVIAHPNQLPANFSLSEYNGNIAYRNTLKGIKSVLETQVSAIDSLLGVTSNNLMIQTIQVLDNARNEAISDTMIAEVMTVLTAKYFHPSSSGKNGATKFSIGSGESITISALIAEKIFTNSGSVILSILNVGGIVTNTIRVNPFSGFAIPRGWVNIVVTNLSPTTEGEFEVFIKTV